MILITYIVEKVYINCTVSQNTLYMVLGKLSNREYLYEVINHKHSQITESKNDKKLVS